MSDDHVPIAVADVWPAEAEEEGVEEGVVINWFTREGQTVREGAVVAEIQLEKVSIDVPAPTGGRLAETAIEEDGVVTEDSVLGYIEPG